MELNITIKTEPCVCTIYVLDDSNYLSESSSGVVKGRFKYSETVSIDVLQHHKLSGDRYVSAVITKHDNSKTIGVPVSFDGHFSILHIVIPSNTWFLNEINKSTGSSLGLYDTVYYSDGDDVYKYFNGEISKSSVEEVINRNPINTTISSTSKEYVSICFLKKCYLNLCNLIFASNTFSKCSTKNSLDPELTYKRDLVWMAINVIKYLTECKSLLEEVERIIELMLACNGICPQSSATNSGKGCGCNNSNSSDSTSLVISKGKTAGKFNTSTSSSDTHIPFTLEEI